MKDVSVETRAEEIYKREAAVLDVARAKSFSNSGRYDLG